MKYFVMVMDGYAEELGLLYAPSDWEYPIARDGEDVKNWQSLVLELRDGIYSHFSDCVSSANVVIKEFKALIESFVGKDFPLEFLPVKVRSKQYGDREMYIMHFTKLFDVIDEKHSTYFIGEAKVLLKIKVDANKVNGMNVFNCKEDINAVYVSDVVRKAIIESKMDMGIQFTEV